MKIMIVDDSRTIRNIQKKTLQQLGHTDVVEAEDGVQALARFNQTSPDIVPIDWNMPNMDGITLVRKVRETTKRSRSSCARPKPNPIARDQGNGVPGMPGATHGRQVNGLTAWFHDLGIIMVQVVSIPGYHLQARMTPGNLIDTRRRIAMVLLAWYKQVAVEVRGSAISDSRVRTQELR